jgi:hypothetical protein
MNRASQGKKVGVAKPDPLTYSRTEVSENLRQIYNGFDIRTKRTPTGERRRAERPH